MYTLCVLILPPNTCRACHKTVCQWHPPPICCHMGHEYKNGRTLHLYVKTRGGIRITQICPMVFAGPIWATSKSFWPLLSVAWNLVTEKIGTSPGGEMHKGVIGNWIGLSQAAIEQSPNSIRRGCRLKVGISRTLKSMCKNYPRYQGRSKEWSLKENPRL